MKPSSWMIAARPKTLSAAAAPVLVGTALAYADRGEVLWAYAAAALIGALFIQIATNFINDALDYKRGADTAERLGPVRVTQAGLLSYDVVLRGAYVCFFLAALCGIPLVLRGGWPLLAIGLASIAAAYAYTGGPYPLAYHALGEVFVLVFFGLIAVGGTYYVLTLQYGFDAFVCGTAIGSLAVVILGINNLRDIPTDKQARKRTLAVLLGERGSKAEVTAFALMPYVLCGLLSWRRDSVGPLAVLASVPLAVILLRIVYRSRGSSLNRALATAGALQLLFAVLLSAGLLVAR